MDDANHSTICRVVNEQIAFDAQEGDGLVTQRPEACPDDDDSRLFASGFR